MMDKRKLTLGIASALLTIGYGLYWLLGETPPAPPPLPPRPWAEGQEFEVKYPDPNGQNMGWIPPVEQPAAVVAMGKKASGDIPTYVRAAKAEGPGPVKKNLSDDAKALLGAHIPTRAQQVGDCVSQGAANAIDYLKCSQWARGPPGPHPFSPTFAPFLYGVSRVQILGGQLGQADGSTGWAGFEAARKYGSLDSNTAGLPPYSGAVARAWGRKPGVPERFFDLARAHKITGARVTCYADVADSLLNGWPVTVASGQGFTRTKISAERLWGLPIGRWPHQMAFIAVDTVIHCPPVAGGGVGACLCINSWGPDAHGPCPDGSPPGSFWVASRIVERMVAEGDSYSYQSVAGFGPPAKDCPEADDAACGGLRRHSLPRPRALWPSGLAAMLNFPVMALPITPDCPNGKCVQPPAPAKANRAAKSADPPRALLPSSALQPGQTQAAPAPLRTYERRPVRWREHHRPNWRRSFDTPRRARFRTDARPAGRAEAATPT
jgi:hypothetical protein